MNMTTLQKRQQRGKRIRKQIGDGTSQRPRLVVYCSNTSTYAQVIDDIAGTTLVNASSMKEKSGSTIQAAEKVGSEIAKLAKNKKISAVVFDRNGYAYHGRVKALAESARKEGLQF